MVEANVVQEIANGTPSGDRGLWTPTMAGAVWGLVGELYEMFGEYIDTSVCNNVEEYLSVAMDCSGYDTPLTALRNLGRTINPCSSSENCAEVEPSLRANHNPKVLYTDGTKRDNSHMKSVDI